MNENNCRSLDKPSSAGPSVVSITSEPLQWGSFLARREDATIYHNPRWGEVMLRAYGNKPFYLTATRNEQVVGVLLLVIQNSLLFGSHLCSVPYFDGAGILADDGVAEAALIKASRELMLERHADWAELRQLRSLRSPLPARTDKVAMRLELRFTSDELWKTIKAKVRNLVRKAEKSDPETVTGGQELLNEFHQVYVRNMRDLGSPPHSRHFFQVICEEFGPAVRFFVVRLGGRPVAASLTLADQHGLHVPWASTDWRFRQLSPSMLLYWRMLVHACDAGHETFDFGRSSRGEGTYQFKKQWGAAETPLRWYYVLREGQELPDLRPDSPKYRLMVACWRKLPLCMARALGPRLISKLS